MYLAVSGDASLATELLADAVDLQRVSRAALAALVAVASAVGAAVHGQLVGGAEAREALVTAQLVQRAHVVHLMFTLREGRWENNEIHHKSHLKGYSECSSQSFWT